MKIKDDPEVNKTLPRYMNNAKLKAAEVQQPLTLEQFEEMQRIIEDPIYFIENYCMIVSIDHGYVPFKMYKYQRELIKLIDSERKTIALYPRQSGKCVKVSTNLRLRNKKTGEIVNTTIGEFYETAKNS